MLNKSWEGKTLVLVLSVIVLLAGFGFPADWPDRAGRIFSASAAPAASAPATGVLVASDGKVTFGNATSNAKEILISRTPSFAGAAWQAIDPVKFKALSQTREVLYVRFRTLPGAVSETVTYDPVLLEGDIVKTPDNPDVYIIKYKGGKQYRRLILSPSVFNSYGHLKWSNLKIVRQAQMDKYAISILVQVAGDKDAFALFPNGDDGEKRVLDRSKPYDADSVYEINTVDRGAYRPNPVIYVAVYCSGASSQACTVSNGTGAQTRTCTGAKWSAWSICAPVSCQSGYQISGNNCVSAVDPTKPVVTAFTLPSSSSSYSVSISSFTATDNVGVTGYALTQSDAAPALSAFTAAKPTSFSFSSSGTRTLYAWVRDAAGNISVPRSASVSISVSTGGGGGGGSTPDTTAPTVTAFTIPATSNSLVITVSSFAATDGVGVTGYMLTESSTAPTAGAAGWTASAPASHTFTTAGDKTLYAWAKDAAGNVSTSLNDSVTIDTTAPTVTAFTIPATAASLTVSISSFTASDAVGVTGYMLTESSSAPAAGAAGWTASAPSAHTFTTAGAKTLYAWARDAAGNVSTSLNDAVTITLADTTAPTVTAFTIPSTADSLTVSVSSFTATDAVGVTGYMLTESSSAPTAGAAGWTGSAPASHTFATAGAKTLYAWAKDAAGNVSASLNDAVTITLDTTGPVISAISASVGTTSATITWTTDENSTSVVNYGLTSGYGSTASSVTQVNSHSIALSGLTASTTYHYRVSSTDASSNPTTSTDRTFTTSAAGAYVTGAMSTSAKVRFLHHSTGAGVWGGGEGVPHYIADYNTANIRSYEVSDKWFAPGGNSPYDFWNTWVNNPGSEDSLETLSDYDVIAFKHCFPVTYVNADTGNPDVTSNNQTEENYKLQYNALKAKMHQFPNKRFILWTGAALTQVSVDEASATRARDFFTWVKNTWDVPGDNIFIWDFWNLETSHDPNTDGLYLLPDHASGGDSHPNGTFNAEVAPLFAQRIVDVIEGDVP